MAGVLGIGGSSALAARRDGFQALATVVAATTLLMAGVSLSKLVPRRRPAPYCPPGAVLSARSRADAAGPLEDAGEGAVGPDLQACGCEMLTIQAMPNRSTHIPNSSPHICVSIGTVTVPPSKRSFSS